MKITLYGAGYVGLVTGTCLAELGNHVLLVDIDEQRIQQLQQGHCPIHEPELPELMRQNQQQGRLQFTTDAQLGVAHGLLQFICVGTPQAENGAANLDHVYEVAETIGQYIEDYRCIITKSTVPVGTALRVQQLVDQHLQARKCSIAFDVASNPEFLREGAAVDDFMQSDRIIIGTQSERAKQELTILYAPLNRNQDRLIAMDIISSELTKYAANAMLATKISFINEMSQLAERVGADIDKVRIGIGADPRIGYHFIQPGCGYGGSCFPKDVNALEHMAQQYDYDIQLLKAVRTVNQAQKRSLFQKISHYFQGQLKDKVFALWGLAFKPNTDDMREASSMVLINLLLAEGARIQAFDPVAIKNAQGLYDQQSAIQFCENCQQTLEGADALVIVTEWNLFLNPDFNMIKAHLRNPVIFDGRNLYDPEYLHGLGFTYYGVGRGASIYREA